MSAPANRKTIDTSCHVLFSFFIWSLIAWPDDNQACPSYENVHSCGNRTKHDDGLFYGHHLLYEKRHQLFSIYRFSLFFLFIFKDTRWQIFKNITHTYN